MHNFRHIEAWKLAREAAVLTYKLTERFPASERFGMITQLRKAAVSIGANIAEGSKRGTNRDFAHFLTIAEGSAAECWYLLDISVEAGYVSATEAAALSERFQQLERMICGFRKQL